MLNLTPDHLDRYANDFQKYYQAKHRIFKGCKSVVENLDDTLTHPLVAKNVDIIGYRLAVSDFNIFGLMTAEIDGEMQECIALAKQPLLATSAIKLPGRHNVVNALAALSIGHLAGFSMPGMLEAIVNFKDWSIAVN